MVCSNDCHRLQAGFSLIENLVALAILAGSSYFASTILTRAERSQVELSALGDLAAFAQNTAASISNPDICLTSLQDVSYSSILSAGEKGVDFNIKTIDKLGLDLIIAKPGIQPNGYKIESIKIVHQSKGLGESYIGNVEMEVNTRRRSSSQGRKVKKYFPLLIKVDSKQNITDCRSPSLGQSSANVMNSNCESFNAKFDPETGICRKEWIGRCDNYGVKGSATVACPAGTALHTARSDRGCRMNGAIDQSGMISTSGTAKVKGVDLNVAPAPYIVDLSPALVATPANVYPSQYQTYNNTCTFKFAKGVNHDNATPQACCLKPFSRWWTWYAEKRNANYVMPNYE